MDHRDTAGIAAASVAVALAAGAWLMGPPPATGDAALEQAGLLALESVGAGQPMLWRDGATGRAATIIPAAAFRAGDGRWCRGYSVVLAADGPPSRHIACRDAGGRWSRPVAGDEQVAGY